MLFPLAGKEGAEHPFMMSQDLVKVPEYFIDKAL
jgi:hypothetical protein